MPEIHNSTKLPQLKPALQNVETKQWKRFLKAVPHVAATVGKKTPTQFVFDLYDRRLITYR